ncbi:pre-mRNA-splicing factor CWC25 homolog isoform X2 [Ananas comosus]|uniref:Pre-mRNA-splicing factor CWC25 homolog isoform X2 n=1 Tax=Ananas comosus TaxID=4615 RepID=A0A6P5EE60_ANACO|nr:pre-mRNA-splicing factor CWC25 homolog isoform X2 [Ananas comosus]
MALKFLNKKGWHTGSLRNIENVWKAEQKHEAEQRKLEELRKQIQDERERSEFRLLQEQAGLVPKQERLDFLYESGLGVGKGSSDGFKALQPAAAPPPPAPAAEASSSKSGAPGALFEDKPQSANDAWRKLHSDPLLLIRQREQEAVARIKNNPIKMAMIKKSVEVEKKQKQEKKEKREKKRDRKHHHDKSKSDKYPSNARSDSEDMSDGEEEKRKRDRPSSAQREYSKSKHGKHSRTYPDSEDIKERRKSDLQLVNHDKHAHRDRSDSEDIEERRKRDHQSVKHDKHARRDRSDSRDVVDGKEERRTRHYSTSDHHHSNPKYEKNLSEVYTHSRDRKGNSSRDGKVEDRRESEQQKAEERETNQHNTHQGAGYNRHRRGVVKMTEEERAARLREMQLDAELHEEQRWKRLKKAADADVQEAMRANSSRGKNFLDEAQKSIFGTEKGGSSTIEESVRRRAYYSQGGLAATESNAFRR